MCINWLNQDESTKTLNTKICVLNSPQNSKKMASLSLPPSTNIPRGTKCDREASRCLLDTLEARELAWCGVDDMEVLSEDAGEQASSAIKSSYIIHHHHHHHHHSHTSSARNKDSTENVWNCWKLQPNSRFGCLLSYPFWQILLLKRRPSSNNRKVQRSWKWFILTENRGRIVGPLIWFIYTYDLFALHF